MRLPAALVSLALAGVGSSIAIAKGSAPDNGTSAATGGRIEICHRTGSAKNPFRTLSVSRAGLEAHMRHGDLMMPSGATCATVAASATS